MDVSVTLYPTSPPAVVPSVSTPVTTAEGEDHFRLGNRFLTVVIAKTDARIREIENHVADTRDDLLGDRLGCSYSIDGTPQGFDSRRDEAPWTPQVQRTPETVTLTLIRGRLRVIYELTAEQFWVERRMVIEAPGCDLGIEDLVYGGGGLRDQHLHELQLGDFDRPRLLVKGRGRDAHGVFVGMGWWFYSVDENGVFRNHDAAYCVRDRFESDPWYLGIFKAEPGEPYTGWHWYKMFLQLRKDACDRQKCWFHWNAGWGSRSVEINDRESGSYFDLCQRLGLDHIIFGSGGYGLTLEAYAAAARTCPATRANLEALASRGMTAGVIESGGRHRQYADAQVLGKKIEALETLAREPGFGGLHFDFFYIDDAYAAKRMARDFLRQARRLLRYTECHLGMARYGPQYQREVQNNHCADLERSAQYLFAADWLTWYGFRESRAGWQQRYGYLMPECGLYYFTTHYHNGGHTRRYTDPEPAQMFYNSGAYAGCAFNFHDRFSYRDALVATAAFSPYPVLGYLEKAMPDADVAFTNGYWTWVKANVAVLRRSRVCHEDRHSCVVTKLLDDRGAIVVLNYSPGRKCFRLALPQLGIAAPVLRPVYPQHGEPLTPRDDVIELTLPGESLLVLSVNDGLRGELPENPRRFPLQLELTSGVAQQVRLPPMRAAVAALHDQTMPEKILLLDLLGLTSSSMATGQNVDPELVLQFEQTVFPEQMWKYYGVCDQQLETWKVAPWAVADRVYFVLSFVDQRPLLSTLLAGELRLEVNDQLVRLIPRIDISRGDVGAWDCPLLFADVTALLIDDADNKFAVELGNLNGFVATLRAAL